MPRTEGRGQDATIRECKMGSTVVQFARAANYIRDEMQAKALGVRPISIEQVRKEMKQVKVRAKPSAKSEADETLPARVGGPLLF